MKKCFNDAVIGNKNIVSSLSNKGELLRLFYPTRDFKQFVDEFLVGVKINDSKIIYLHDDINNVYNQYYVENTNVLKTEIKNTYFNLSITQTDFVPIDKDIIIRRYKLKNENWIDLNINFLTYSKLISDSNNMVGGLVKDNKLIQYTHDYTFKISSNYNILNYKLNDSKQDLFDGILSDKDYIGMSNDSALSYDIGTLKSGEEREIDIFISISNNKNEKKDKIEDINVKKEEENTIKYWQEYVKKHDGLNLLKEENIDQIKKVYIRSILLFPLLTNHETGGISAAMEVDEERQNSGRYSYCWPRDAVFITKALDTLKMEEMTERFYNVFCKNTQSEDGMWEQRFYTDGKLAPCWGYQIDETASVVFGIYEHYLYTKNIQFLKDTFSMCENAVEYLKKYIDYIIEEKTTGLTFEKYESYDLWEMNEGIHLYSLASIYAAFSSMIEIYNLLEEDNIKNKREELKEYLTKIKEYSMEELLDKNSNMLKRSNKNDKIDISILGTVIPFNMYESNSNEIKNTIEKMNMTLRTYTGGYIRFENDSYMGGINPWPVATLWMALYNLKIGKKDEAKRQLEYIANSSNEHGFLPEQIDNQTIKPKWVIGLGWSHAMFIQTLGSIGMEEMNGKSKNNICM